jgi:hypothetical protein
LRFCFYGCNWHPHPRTSSTPFPFDLQSFASSKTFADFWGRLAIHGLLALYAWRRVLPGGFSTARVRCVCWSNFETMWRRRPLAWLAQCFEGWGRQWSMCRRGSEKQSAFLWSHLLTTGW